MTYQIMQKLQNKQTEFWNF